MGFLCLVSWYYTALHSTFSSKSCLQLAQLTVSKEPQGDGIVNLPPSIVDFVLNEILMVKGVGRKGWISAQLVAIKNLESKMSFHDEMLCSFIIAYAAKPQDTCSISRT